MDSLVLHLPSAIAGFDEEVLLAVAHLREPAYGTNIWEALEEALGGPVTIGRLYAALDRLEEQGFVSSWRGDPTPERGGRAKRFYKLEGAGERALEEAERTRNRLRQLATRGATA